MATSDGPADAREELARIAASLRAYLEWQEDTGASGIPRKPRSSAASPRGDAPPAAPAAATHAVAPTPAAPVPMGQVIDSLPAAAAAVAPAVAPAAAPAPPPAPRALELVQAEVAACTRCGLAPTRTNTVFARGNPAAALCFVGEGPGAEEDAQGIPFVGRAGQLLDRMIQAMGLDPARDVYVCNIVKCRPPGNRRPEPDEIEACIPYLHEQLAAVRPKAIVALGNTAVAALLGSKLGITKMRGQWKLYKGSVPVMPTYHPSYLLRPSAQQVEAKKQAWEDLQAVMKHLGIAPRKA
jgi:uracil-DNA glycosylase